MKALHLRLLSLLVYGDWVSFFLSWNRVGAHVPRARDGEGEHVLWSLQTASVSPMQAGRIPRQPQSHFHEQCLQDPQGNADELWKKRCVQTRVENFRIHVIWTVWVNWRVHLLWVYDKDLSELAHNATINSNFTHLKEKQVLTIYIHLCTDFDVLNNAFVPE